MCTGNKKKNKKPTDWLASNYNVSKTELNFPIVGGKSFKSFEAGNFSLKSKDYVY